MDTPTALRPIHPSRLSRALGRLVPLLIGLLLLWVPGVARAEGVEVIEVRTDNYPRMIVRFTASAEDGTPLTSIRPNQLLVWENGVAQQQVNLYSLRETSPEVWVSLVVDVSGSMNDDDKLNQAKAAAKAFIARLRSKDRTSIVTFSDRVVLQQQATGDPGVLGRAIDSLQAKGPTRLYDGIERGVAEALRARTGTRQAVIVLTDGEDTDSQTTLEAALAPALEAKIPIYTVGLGSDVRSDVLGEIAASTKGRFYAAPRASDLDLVFKLLSGQIAAQYEAWWPSISQDASGSSVEGRLAIDLPGVSPLQTTFNYVMPVRLRQQPRAERNTAGPDLAAVVAPESGGLALPDWWPAAAATLAAAGIYLAYCGGVLRLTRTRLQNRLGTFVGAYHAPRGRPGQARQTSSQSIRPMILALARLSHRMMPTRMLDELRHRLVLAGRPSGWHFSQFLAAKLLLSGGLGMAGYLWVIAQEQITAQMIGMAVALVLLGYYLPHPWLGSLIKQRQKAVQRALPDCLDLLTVGVGAGLSLDGAILEYVEKSEGPLAVELANFLAELRMGRSRREALQGLLARTEVEDIRVLVASLLQAEELGMSLSETLVVQADQMRLRRRQRAEELAHKATVKMMIPMVMLIFPALFVVIMGPAVPGLMGFLGGGK